MIHIGAHEAEEAETYRLSGWGAHQTVWVEANPEKASKCQEVIGSDSRQRVICALLSDRSGDEVDFFVASNGQSSSMLKPTRHADSLSPYLF